MSVNFVMRHDVGYGMYSKIASTSASIAGPSS